MRLPPQRLPDFPVAITADFFAFFPPRPTSLRLRRRVIPSEAGLLIPSGCERYELHRCSARYFGAK
jgi:hypothetical protein